MIAKRILTLQGGSKHGLTQEPHTLDPAQSRARKARGRAADFEARHGGQSFLAWTQAHARAALLVARDGGTGWQAVHQVAATFDLDVTLRGAGLVVSHRSDGRLHVKASDVDRGLSLKGVGQGRKPAPLPIPDVHCALQRQCQMPPPSRSRSCRLTNRPAYEASLRRRGDLTGW